MKGTAQFQNADSIEVSLTLTDTLGHWKELRTQLAQRWPSYQLGHLLDRLIQGVEGRIVKLEAGQKKDEDDE